MKQDRDQELIAERYRLVGPALGRGGEGEVFRALDTRGGQWVALKLLDRSSRLVRELRTLSLSHVHLCPIWDFGSWRGRAFVVMELAAQSLEQQFRGAPPESEWDDRLCELLQLVAGLACLHRAGILHRDLKPANVLRMTDGRLVLADFGLSARAREACTRFVGTVGYLAPECALGAPASYASDVWALGLILHRLFFFVSPRWVMGSDGPRIVSTVPRERAGKVHTQVHRLCLSCLAFDPSARPRDASAVRAQLGRIIDGCELNIEVGERAEHPIVLRVQRSWERMIVSALAFGLVLFVLLLVGRLVV